MGRVNKNPLDKDYPEHEWGDEVPDPDDEVDRPDSDMRCPNCAEWLPVENYGKTEDKMYFISSCPECDHTLVKPTAHGMMVRTIDEGEDPEEVFAETFPEHIVERMDFSGLRDSHRMQEDMESDQPVKALLESGEEEDLTDLIRDSDRR